MYLSVFVRVAAAAAVASNDGISLKITNWTMSTTDRDPFVSFNQHLNVSTLSIKKEVINNHVTSAVHAYNREVNLFQEK